MKTDLELVKKLYDVIDDKFGKDIVVLDISKNSSLADYFIIASGSSNTQVKAIADWVEESAKKNGLELKQREGYQTSDWILLDFYNIIVHIFIEEQRQYYDLDKAWKNAIKVEI